MVVSAMKNLRAKKRPFPIRNSLKNTILNNFIF